MKWLKKNNFAHNKNIEEKTFLFNHKMTKIPTCKTCWKELKFWLKKYFTYCSNNCFINNEEENLKRHLKINKKAYKNLTELIKELIVSMPTLEDYIENWKKYWKHNLICKKCNTSFKDYLNYNWLPKCPQCNPRIRNKKEKELAKFIRDKNEWIELIQNTRQIIKPLELDIYVPEKKFAIEYNWLLFHSYWITYWNKTNNYLEKALNNYKLEKRDDHLNKTEMCEKKWIELLHIFGNEWSKKQHIRIWENIINMKLWNYEKSFNMEQILVEKIDIWVANNFLKLNSIEWEIKKWIAFWTRSKESKEMLQVIIINKLEEEIYEISRIGTKIWVKIEKEYYFAIEHIKNLELKKWNKLIYKFDRKYWKGKEFIESWMKQEKKLPPEWFFFNSKRSWKTKEQLKWKETIKLFEEGYRRVWNSGYKNYITKKK